MLYSKQCSACDVNGATLFVSSTYHLRTGEQLRGDIAKLTEEKRAAFAEVDMLVKVIVRQPFTATTATRFPPLRLRSIAAPCRSACGAVRGEARRGMRALSRSMDRIELAALRTIPL